MGGTASKISSWKDGAACEAKAKGTALATLKVGGRLEEKILKACSEEGATYYSEPDGECKECPALTVMETFSKPDCSGESVYTATYNGELSEQNFADSCGRAARFGKVGTAYYKAAAGEMGGTEAACTRCPPVTEVYGFMNMECTSNSDLYGHYYYGILPKNAPEVSGATTKACDFRNSLTFSAKTYGTEVTQEIVGCTKCPAVSAVRAYPYAECKAEARDAARAEKEDRLWEVVKKSASIDELDDVMELQNADLTIAEILRQYGSKEALFKEKDIAEARQAEIDAAKKLDPKITDEIHWSQRDAINNAKKFMDAINMRYNGHGKGLTEAEVQEAYKLALDLADDPVDLSVQERVVNVEDASDAEHLHAVRMEAEELCDGAGAFKEFAGWGAGSQAELRNAQFTKLPTKSISVVKMTDRGEEAACMPCHEYKTVVECYLNGEKKFETTTDYECRHLNTDEDKNYIPDKPGSVSARIFKYHCTYWGGCDLISKESKPIDEVYLRLDEGTQEVEEEAEAAEAEEGDYEADLELEEAGLAACAPEAQEAELPEGLLAQ
eukprot:tig00000498_g1577.t1